jgi:hypothetical protein
MYTVKIGQSAERESQQDPNHMTVTDVVRPQSANIPGIKISSARNLVRKNVSTARDCLNMKKHVTQP